MRSPDIDEQEDNDVYENFAARNDSSTGEMTKQRTTTHRSKHSETEQRRRIKINERFQSLMDLLPQSDQKRDKASFLLEVIEYIQFLQAKLQMYEGSHQMWNQSPAKLTPWRNNDRPAEDIIDQSIQTWSIQEKTLASQVLLSDVQHSLESDLVSFPAYKPQDLNPASATASTTPLSMKTENNLFAPQFENDINQQPNMKPESSVSPSSVSSQRVFNSLTEAFQSAGVDLSRTTISVRLDVAKKADYEPIVATSTSKDNCNQVLEHEMAYLDGVRRSFGESNQPQKKVRH